VEGLTSLGQVADTGGVAFWAHIGGFMSGILGVLLLQQYRRRHRW
jgi:membrane associated rhomboid family serine protease